MTLAAPHVSEILRLKHAEDLRRIQLSSLARNGSAVLREMLVDNDPIAIDVQGMGAMVTMTQSQYEAVVRLIDSLKEEQADYLQRMAQEFDELVARMNAPDAAEATGKALFADAEKLGAGYAPGDTEHRA